MGLVGLHVDPSDAGAGQDVMELVQQQLLPQGVSLGQVILQAPPEP